MNIDEINDHFEIERLMTKYVEAIDNKDWNMLDEVFTERFLDYESSGGLMGKGYPLSRNGFRRIYLCSDDTAYDRQVIY